MTAPLAGTTRAPGVDAPRVAVWRHEWLAPSETFIQNQIAAMHRWRPLPVGLRRLPDGLPVRPVRVLGDDRVSQVARQVDVRLGLRWYGHFLRRERVQVVHAHFGPDAITVLPLARRLGLPLVVTFHGFDVTSAPVEDTDGKYVRQLREVFGYATTLVAVSEFIADQLRSLGAPAGKIVIAPIGIPVARDPAAAPTDPTLPTDRSGITFVGRLVQKKGVSDLIDAVGAVPTELLQGHTVDIIGYGPDEEMLRAKAARAALPVRFLGRRDPAFIADRLSHSRIFCAPSRTAPNGDAEGFGMVYLEAALQSVPVVAYQHGGVRESVVDGVTGLLSPEGDVAALSATITRLLSDPGLAASMGEAGRQRVLRDFDIEVCTLRLEQIYDDAVSSSGRHDRLPTQRDRRRESRTTVTPA